MSALLRSAASILAASVVALGWASAAEAAPQPLKVCADPNNLPFSNSAGEGFENRIADIVAADMGRTVEYTWWAQRRGFLRNTLKKGKCDVVMGVPIDLDMLATTRPYYRSRYVYVYRTDSGLDLHSMRDPRLRDLRIGVNLVGDDGTNPPPAHALGRQGIVDNVVGYLVYGDYKDAAPGRPIIDAVADGQIDVAAVWGPLGGYFAREEPTPLTIAPITDGDSFAPLTFAFSIGMGVRKGDDDLRRTLDDVIARRHQDIQAVLRDYGVPLAGAGEDPQTLRSVDFQEGKGR